MPQIVQHLFGTGQHVVVPIPKRLDARVCQGGVAFGVADGIQMLAAIEFDRQRQFVAVKIQGVGRPRMLAAELHLVQAAIAQQVPEQGFGIGGCLAQLPGEGEGFGGKGLFGGWRKNRSALIRPSGTFSRREKGWGKRGFHHAAVEGLLDAVGGDEAEPLRGAFAHFLRGDMPPIHHQIRRFGHFVPRRAQRIHIAVTKRAAHRACANERRIAHDEIRLRPLRLARVHVAPQRHACGFVGNLLARHRRFLHGFAVPAGDGNAAFIQHRRCVVISQYGIAVFDVAKIADHRDGRMHVATGAEVPLQVADPQHHFGNRRRARVQFDAQKVVRIDGFARGAVGAFALQRQRGLAVAQFVQRVEDFAFQALEVFQRDVKKIAAATGRIEHAQVAKPAMKAAQRGDGLLRVAFGLLQHRGGLGFAPLRTQRLDHGGQHEPLHIGARRVVRAKFVAILGRKRALQQGAEDGRFNVLPIRPGSLQQPFDLGFRQRQRIRLLEQLAVEAQNVCGNGGGKPAAVHVAPQRGEHPHRHIRLFGVFLQQIAEGVGRQQFHVLGEHGEQAAHQKLRHGFRAVATGFQRFGQLRQLRGDLAGDAGGFARGIQRERIEPEVAQAFADFFLRQILQRDAMAARVGKRRVGCT